MTPAETQLSKMQDEWRKSVMEHMQSQETKMDKLLESVNDIKQEYVRASVFDKALTRLATLESDKQKVIGAMFLLNVLGGMVLWLITKFWK